MEPTPVPPAPLPPQRHRSPNAIAGRLVLMVVCLALVASAAFSIGEMRGARHHTQLSPAPALGAGALSGLSIARLQQLQSEVQQARALAQGTNASDDLSQLEQQLGISPSSITGDASQLQAELNAINACLGGSSSNVPAGC